MSERTRVLMLVDSLYPGGAERMVAGLAVRLPRERYEVTVCATRRHEGPLVAELEEAGIRYVTLDRRGRFDLAPFRRLARLMREQRFHIVHTHKFGSNVWGAIFGTLLRVPVVIAHEHSWSYEGQPLRRFLDGRVIGRLADAFVAVSTRDQERMASIEGVPAEKITFIPNAAMPRVGEVPAGDLRAELGIAPGAPVAGAMCVLRAQKAIDVLLDAFAIVAARLPDAHLVIAGYGPKAEEWQAYGESLGLPRDRVHWLGMRSDGPVVLDGLDVAVMSSDFEGTPLFAFECMAARTPMVATDVGGFRDVFTDGESALLVPPRDPRAMAEALETLLTDPERRSAMGDAAHARLDEFTVERVVDRVGELYDTLLGRAGQPRDRALAGVAA